MTKATAQLSGSGWDDDRQRRVVALSLLSASEQPVGARQLSDALRAEGLDLAEATAGRLLRTLDHEGLTRNSGRRGRVLTALGGRLLDELRLQEAFASQSAQIAEAANADDLAQLLHLLDTRRGIEAEAARLAAMRATEAEQQAITAAAHEHVSCIHLPARIDHSHSFHMLIARACGNPMILSVMTLLLGLHNHKLAKLLDQLMETSPADSGLVKVQDGARHHVELARAIAERNAPGAESLMRAHIDEMIRVAVRRRPPA